MSEACSPRASVSDSLHKHDGNNPLRPNAGLASFEGIEPHGTVFLRNLSVLLALLCSQEPRIEHELLKRPQFFPNCIRILCM